MRWFTDGLCVQVEDVVKLLHIMKSPAMDTALKKTALEQLVLLLKGQCEEIECVCIFIT